MKIGIRDDKPLVEIQRGIGNAVGATKRCIDSLGRKNFAVALSEVSQSFEEHDNFDFEFFEISKDDTPSKDRFDALLIDLQLDDDNPSDLSGLQYARKWFAAGVPKWRIAIFSRNPAEPHLRGNLPYESFDKKSDPDMEDRLPAWLINLLNAPSRKFVPSSALYGSGLLKEGSLIDKAFHSGQLHDEDISEKENPIISLNSILDSGAFPEVSILAGAHGEHGIDAVWSGAIALNSLSNYYPTCACDGPWTRVQALIQCDKLTNQPALRSVKMLDWLFPRATFVADHPLVEKVLEQSCANCAPHAQSFEKLNSVEWITDVTAFNGHLRVPMSCWTDFRSEHLIKSVAKAPQRTWKVGFFSGHNGVVFVVVECHGKGFPSEAQFYKYLMKVFPKTRSFCHLFAGAWIDERSSVAELLPAGFNPAERRISAQVVPYNGHHIDFTFGGHGAPSSAYVWILDIE